MHHDDRSVPGGVHGLLKLYVHLVYRDIRPAGGAGLAFGGMELLRLATDEETSLALRLPEVCSPRRPSVPNMRVRRRVWSSSYLNLSATFARAALAHAASLSPPGAPLTKRSVPMVASPTLIGTAPCALIVPGIVAGGAVVPGAGGVAGPDGLLYSIVAVAFILATSVVDAVAPSSRSMALVALSASTTSTVTL